MVFFLFCILVDRTVGWGYSPPPPSGYATEKATVFLFFFTKKTLVKMQCFDKIYELSHKKSMMIFRQSFNVV